METAISLDSGVFAGNAKVSVVNGPDIKAENTAEKPDQVGIHETALKTSGKSFTTTFEPHSVTVLECAIS
jgi:alpha-L-arabinofuranosidase